MKRTVMEFSMSGTDGPWYPMRQLPGNHWLFPAYTDGKNIDARRADNFHLRTRVEVVVSKGMSWSEAGMVYTVVSEEAYINAVGSKGGRVWVVRSEWTAQTSGNRCTNHTIRTERSIEKDYLEYSN